MRGIAVLPPAPLRCRGHGGLSIPDHAVLFSFKNERRRGGTRTRGEGECVTELECETFRSEDHDRQYGKAAWRSKMRQGADDNEGRGRGRKRGSTRM